MDPHQVLGVPPGASADELTSSYRELAKRWHPDRHASGETDLAAQRMAEINAAYELLRSELWQAEQRRGRKASADAPSAPARIAGDWLPAATRRALGPELLSALQQAEQVRLVTPASAWASPETLLAVTDRRLLWLLDDAVTGRVRSLAYPAITDVAVRLSWPRRKRAVLRVGRRDGKRPITFSELRPETARTIAGHVEARAAAA